MQNYGGFRFYHLLGLPLLCVLFFGGPAKALGLREHKLVTLQAIAEFNRCFQQKIDGFQSFVMWQADLDEDLNLIRKETLYSHFYNPNKKLDMRRYDSSVSVLNYQENLLHMAAKSWENLDNLATLGHAVHHIQDMAVPAHVVPVMHGLDDGFENYAFNGDISSGIPCEGLLEMARGHDLMDLLRRTAVDTLAVLKSTQVPLMAIRQQSSTPIFANAEAFWKPSNDNQFGHYGFLDNNFGQTSFDVSTHHFRVPESFYAQFKQRQLRTAVQGTLLAMGWWVLQNPKLPMTEPAELQLEPIP